jgi:hypothetical protein
MSASARKDHCFGLAMHPVPAYVSQQEFKAKVDALVDSLLVLPVCEQNFINFDVVRNAICYSSGRHLQEHSFGRMIYLRRT